MSNKYNSGLSTPNNHNRMIDHQKFIQEIVRETLKVDEMAHDAQVDWFSFEIKMRESMTALLEPISRRIVDLRQDQQAYQKDLSKIQQQFLEFEEQFMPTNTNNPSAIQRRQALIDLVFKKINEAEEERRMDQMAIIQRIQSGENRQIFMTEKLNIFDHNFKQQSVVIDDLKEEIANYHKIDGNSRQELVKELNRQNESTNARIDTVEAKLRSKIFDKRQSDEQIQQCKQNFDQQNIMVEKQEFFIEQLQKKFSLLESVNSIEEQHLRNTEIDLKLKKLQEFDIDIE
ncbi:UNKNOWN [Stylonychia lemnae]|uniref:Uncharacterized protein n=1 Tax=Stylonychia lemnae TaxID=5949 RepID=A0A078AAA1_STYLE|nr:UNKNOWN [Stylonychia lemnae]|eukprot:CDW78507.1 UNKNOWN [Stylonychia lemnae]